MLHKYRDDAQISFWILGLADAGGRQLVLVVVFEVFDMFFGKFTAGTSV